MKVNLKDNIFWGLGISLLLLLMSSAASYISIGNLIRSSNLVEQSNAVLDNLYTLSSTVKDAETSQRGFLLTNNPSFLEQYNEAKPITSSMVDEIEIETADNPGQMVHLKKLRSFVEGRMESLQEVLDKKERGDAVFGASFLDGKKYMDGIREVIMEMKDEERQLLNSRTASLNQWAGYTPVIIIITALLAIGLSLFFYRRVSSDFREKMQLQNELEVKNKQIQDRIDEIENLARQVSSGNYTIRFKQDNDDKIGSLAISLNMMAESLGKSFLLLQNKEWLQTGVAAVSDQLVGQKSVETLASDALITIANYTESQAGAIYTMNPMEQLEYSAGYCLDLSSLKKRFLKGEGIPGQAAQSEKIILIDDMSDDDLSVSFVSGKVKPKHIIAISVQRDNKIVGVLELASLKKYTDIDIEFLEGITDNIGAAIVAAQSRKRLQELLEETQSQSEELQSQTSELENINAELEAQSQKLQASEEELRVQQEELLQSNQELEERTSLLEERNQVIRERNSEIEQKSKDLEQSSKYKSEFLANMSHELRTPLNSILLLSKLMSDSESLDKEYVEYADVIQSSGQGLLMLIDEILDLSKIESGKMQLEISDVPLEEVVSEMKAIFMPVANSKKLDFSLNIKKGTPLKLRTDKLRLEQILKNLLSNAIKFTSEGKVSLTIAADEKEESVVFVVRDTGIGVAKDKFNLVFEAFQQADGSTRRKFGGTGQGLSISRELSKLLGGEIKLKSEENEGSEFSLILPLNYAGEKHIEKPVEKEQSLTPGGSTNEAKLPGKTEAARFAINYFNDDRDKIINGDKVILIIEDDTSFAKILVDYTRKKKYKCIATISGEEGIEMANKFKPIAILLDILLPGINGWQVLENLKSNPATRSIPVHTMSSMEVRKESILSGAIDFINKPFALEEMKQVFEKIEKTLLSHKKVLIVEENKAHAQALAYFLSTNQISTQVAANITDSVEALRRNEIDCVILDMGVPDKKSYDTLEAIKENKGLENLPIIVFTGKNLSKGEENRIKKYADSIVIKTAHSYQRILDEAGLFLHLVEEENRTADKKPRSQKMMELRNILKEKSVLIVDDDVRNIFSLSKALELHHMKVLTAVDGKEAMSIMKENNKIDVVLMDMMMPEMDGYETIRQIRLMPRYKYTPILAVTAKAMVGDREKCIAAGASDYISKPVDVDQLISLLRVWLYSDK